MTCLAQAIYLAANEPHAYVSGQIIECMATSDNVVRAGLTPKLRCVLSWHHMLSWTCKLRIEHDCLRCQQGHGGAVRIIDIYPSISACPRWRGGAAIYQCI